MIGRYAVLSSRIRQDAGEIERVVERIERALVAAQTSDADRDLFVDSAALNLHDLYTGLERIFTHIATSVDQSTPSGPDWHRELLRQMTVEVPGLRPHVISADAAIELDEYLRFRHVVRHIYAFELDSVRVQEIARRIGSVFRGLQAELEAFARYLETLAREP